ncbi:MAG: tRNA (adenosine(37)-N6)-threonylcarbamoyltransferase complex transferase subunit TsaD [Patescibacteria group bacterium]|nr:tRNA (adenosine(37)-N6)-threonylcarbamoyltransferase complex transferase subunit TsaD [Patescibacteria group bacterium]MDE2172453.1 tRNA (adenosine(37)-N6)-threonylcarbamoyltransferase complex transferase subunit TsaD [Patescibacteria group bacterium]
MTILGIETSCDETALALIETRPAGHELEVRVGASLVHSQADLHSAYGGVFPTLAKREHGRNLIPLLHRLLVKAALAEAPDRFVDDERYASAMSRFNSEFAPQNPDLCDSFSGAAFLKRIPPIDMIAVTEGPGLEPALWVGITAARMLGELWQMPVVPVNHMEGHIVGSLLDETVPTGAWQTLKKPALPAIALLVSGGHTELVKVSEHGYAVIGETLDDAAGEAYDKVARLLGLPYPGGPHISMLAKQAEDAGIRSSVKLPRPMKSSGDLNFSFAGLKTAVLYAVRTASSDGSLAEDWKRGLAREFEDAVAETLTAKVRAAIELAGARTLIAGGGVMANTRLRHECLDIGAEYGIPVLLPSQRLSGDNALMIALAAGLDHSRHIQVQRTLKADGTKRLGPF